MPSTAAADGKHASALMQILRDAADFPLLVRVMRTTATLLLLCVALPASSAYRLLRPPPAARRHGAAVRMGLFDTLFGGGAIAANTQGVR